MKIAVIAVTKQGIKKGLEVETALNELGHQVTSFVPGKYSLLSLPGHRVPFRKSLREMLARLMREYEGIVCIMAMGIVVRLIAPCLKDKRSDPAVVVMDEMGRNVISVLSGHWGGANDLTRQIASALAANAVITTATDTHGLPAVEMLAKEKDWIVEPFEMVKTINAAIVNSVDVDFYCDDPLDMELPANIKQYPVSQYNPRVISNSPQVVVSNRFFTGGGENTLFLRPKNLVVGIGCRRGSSSEQIQKAVMEGLARADLALKSLRAIATVELKADEAGLLAAAESWQLPMCFYTEKEIKEFFAGTSQKLAKSAFVKEQIGVDGVCEPTALMAAANKGRLLLQKMAHDGITVAVAEDV